MLQSSGALQYADIRNDWLRPVVAGQEYGTVMKLLNIAVPRDSASQV